MSWYLDDDFWRLYRDAMFNPESFERGETEVSELLQLIGQSPDQAGNPASGRVLDLACGPGRHSIPLAVRGFEVVGVDASKYLLDWARQQAKDRAPELAHQPQFEIADMREYMREDAFDLILCMWTSFGYFEDPADDLAVLGNVYDSLKPGGSFVLDTVGKEWLVRNIQPVHLRELSDDTLLLERPLLEDNMSRLSNQWILIRDGKADTREWAHNLYSGVEIRDRLYASGFDHIDLYGSLQGDDYDLDAERLIAVARKDPGAS